MAKIINFKMISVVGRLCPTPTPKHVHILNCASVTLYGKEEIRFQIELWFLIN